MVLLGVAPAAELGNEGAVLREIIETGAGGEAAIRPAFAAQTGPPDAATRGASQRTTTRPLMYGWTEQT